MPDRAVWEQAGLRLPPGADGGPGDQLDALQLALNQRMGSLALLPESDPGYADACDDVFAAALALVGAENRVPVLLAERSHRLSRWLLWGCGGFAGLVGIGVGLATGWGWLSAWWAIVAVAALGAGLLVLRTPVHPPSGPHVRQRFGGAEVALGVALLGWLTVAFGLAPGMSGGTAAWVFAAAGVLIGLGLATLRTSVQVHPRASGMASDDLRGTSRSIR